MPTIRGSEIMHDTQLTLTADANPDTSVTLRCRIRSTEPAIGGALLRFILPGEAVVGADEPAAIVLGECASSGEQTLERIVGIHHAVADRAELRFAAVVVLADGSLHHAHAPALQLQRRARLNGPQTSLTVLPTDVPDEVVVQARIVNDGSATAHAFVVDVPAPVGTEPIEPLATTSALDRLAVGETQTFAYRARVVSPCAHSVRVTDASIVDTAGARIALAPSAPLGLSPALSAPEFRINRDGRRLQIELMGANTGAGCANELELRVRWPNGFACNLPSLAWNDTSVGALESARAFARARQRADGLDLLIASVHAGEPYKLRFELDASTLAKSGTLAVDVDIAGTVRAHAETTLPWMPRSDIRLRVCAQPDAAVEVGTAARLTIDLLNAGDAESHIVPALDGADGRLSIADVPLAPGETVRLAAGDHRRLTLDVDVPGGRRHGEQFAFAVLARVADSVAAHAAFAVRVREGASPKKPSPEPIRLATLCAPPDCAPFGSRVTLALAFTATQLETSIVLLSGRPRLGLISHVLSLPALLVTSAGGDSELAAALSTLNAALDGLLARLALKLRLPGWTAARADCEDAATRRAIQAVFSAIGDHDGGSVSPTDTPVWMRTPLLTVSIERSWARKQAALLGQTPPVPGAAFAGLMALLPATSTLAEPCNAALETYVGSLRSTFLNEAGTTASVPDTGLESLDTQRRRLHAALTEFSEAGSAATSAS